MLKITGINPLVKDLLFADKDNTIDKIYGSSNKIKFQANSQIKFINSKNLIKFDFYLSSNH